MARRAVLLAAVVAAGCWAQPEDGGVPGPKVDLAPLTSTVGRTAPAARAARPPTLGRRSRPPSASRPAGGTVWSRPGAKRWPPPTSG